MRVIKVKRLLDHSRRTSLTRVRINVACLRYLRTCSLSVIAPLGINSPPQSHLKTSVLNTRASIGVTSKQRISCHRSDTATMVLNEKVLAFQKARTLEFTVSGASLEGPYQSVLLQLVKVKPFPPTSEVMERIFAIDKVSRPSKIFFLRLVYVALPALDSVILP